MSSSQEPKSRLEELQRRDMALRAELGLTQKVNSPKHLLANVTSVIGELSGFPFSQSVMESLQDLRTQLDSLLRQGGEADEAAISGFSLGFAGIVRSYPEVARAYSIVINEFIVQTIRDQLIALNDAPIVETPNEQAPNLQADLKFQLLEAEKKVIEGRNALKGTK